MIAREPPPEVAAFLALARAHERAAAALIALLRPCGLTLTAYNVLRILRGAHPAGLRCGEVAARMVNRLPDITRLLDRLERAGHVVRQRGKEDRRVVETRITPRGLDLLARLDEPVREAHAAHCKGLTRRDLTQLIALLDRFCT